MQTSDNQRMYFKDLWGNTLTATGLAYVDASGYIYDSSVETTVVFDESGATASGTVDGTSWIYSFDRTDDSASLSEIAGTHTNPDDGSAWTIDTDGNFTVNGVCIISGILTRKDAYFTAENVTASSCSDSDFDATDYTARVVTVQHDGSTYILGAMANNDGIIWGSTPL